MPLIINRIGGKNALLLAGTIMSVNSYYWLIVRHQRWKWLFRKRCICLKYRSCWRAPSKILPASLKCVFQRRFYLVCFCFFKQLAMIFMSVMAGNMYESIGFQGANRCWVWWRWASP
ncbi:MFS transporter [Escherichia coli]